MIEKAIRDNIHLYRESHPNESLDQFIAAVNVDLRKITGLDEDPVKNGDALRAFFKFNEDWIDDSLEEDEVRINGKIVKVDDHETHIKANIAAEKRLSDLKEDPEVELTSENFGELLVKSMEQALDHAKSENEVEPINYTNRKMVSKQELDKMFPNLNSPNVTPLPRGMHIIEYTGEYPFVDGIELNVGDRILINMPKESNFVKSTKKIISDFIKRFK